MKYTRSKTALFLIELIIAILFFAFASAICIQLFARAQLLSRRSAAMDTAMLQMESCAEIYTATGGDFDAVLNYLGASSVPEDTLTLYYNNTFTPCEESGAFYILTITHQVEAIGLTSIYITAVEQGGPLLFEFTQAVYNPPLEHTA